MTIALPRLEIAETMSPFDEAVITIDGREEETITIACVGSRELAERIVQLVNDVRRLQGAAPTQGWQPMASAPKDGRSIIARSNDRQVLRIYWGQDRWFNMDGDEVADLAEWSPYPADTRPQSRQGR